MKILAMDPSLTSFGWALWENGEITSGLISPSSRGMARVHELLLGVRANAESLDLALIEGYSFGSQGQGRLDTAEMRGVLSYYLWQYNIPLVHIPPTKIKIIATGSGKGDKIKVVQQAWKRLGYEGTSDDIADALWMLQLALVHYDLPGAAQLPKSHTRALDEKIKWPVVKALRRVA